MNVKTLIFYRKAIDILTSQNENFLGLLGLKVMLHGTICNTTLLHEKSIPCNMTLNSLQQQRRYLKSVQSCATRCSNKCCVKNRVDFCTTMLR